MDKYAFIDVRNADATTSELCGFYIDWGKLHKHLIERLGCKQAFYYTGIEQGNDEETKEFDALSRLDSSVARTKPMQIYKIPDRKISVVCNKCGESVVDTIDMGYKRKGNCDVDLTIDLLENAKSETEMYLFTGDGDFAPLVRKAIERGVSKVHIVSSDKVIMRAGIPNRRLSTKIKALFKEFRGKVDLVDIDSLRDRIKKDII